MILEEKLMRSQAIIIIGLIATVIFFGTVQYAQAEMLVIGATNYVMDIFIIIENDENLIYIVTDEGYKVIHDSEFENHPKGAFSLSDTETGLTLWAQPLSETQYIVVIITDEGTQILIGTIFYHEED